MSPVRGHRLASPPDSLLDSLPAGVVLLREQRIVYCNEPLLEMLDLPAESLLGREFLDFIAPGDKARVFTRHVGRLQGEPLPDNYEVDLCLGGDRKLRVHIEPSRLGPDELLVMVRDVTATARDIDLANRLTELALKLQRQQSVEDVILAAANGLAQMNFRMGTLRLDDDGSVRFLRPRQPVSLDSLLRERAGMGLADMRIPLERVPTVMRSLHERRAIYIDDALAWMRHSLPSAGFPEGALEAIVREGGAKKGVLAPLYVAEKPWGALFIGADSLTPLDAATITLFASQFATAIDVARTITELNQTNQNLQAIHELARLGSEHELDRVLPRLLAMSLATTRSDRSQIHLYDEEKGELLLAGGKGIEAPPPSDRVPLDELAGPLAKVIRDRVPLAVPSTERPITEMLLLPLQIRGILCGILTLGRVDGERYTEEEIRAVEPFAAQLAIQLETARLFEEERRRVQDLSQINELGRQLAQHLDIPALVELGVEHLCRLVDIPQVFLSLIDPERGLLTVVGTNFDHGDDIPLELGVDEPSTAVAAIRDMRPVVVTDPQTDPRGSRTLSQRFGHKIQLGIPLISRGEAIGAVVLAETRADRRFRQAEVERAVTIANQVAAAIASARLFEEERKRVRELSLHSEIGRIASATLQSDVLLSECLRCLSTNLGFDFGAAWVTGGEKDQPPSVELPSTLVPTRHLAARNLAASLSRTAMEDGVPRSSMGDEGLFGCAIPLRAGAEVLGALSLVRQDLPATDADLTILQAIAPEVGVALQNAFLFADVRRRVEDLGLLLEIGRAITGSLDLDEILQTSALTVSRLVDSSNAFILLLDEERDELVGAACSSPDWRDSFRKLRIPVDSNSVPSICVRSGERQVIPDVAMSPFADNARVKLYGEKSLLALPLLVRDEAIGCLLLDDVRRPRDWKPEEIERATVIALQVAIAMANARLYEDLKESYGVLARTQEELVKRERLAALGELSAVVAHEVRNPLGVIFNSLGSIRRMLQPTGDAEMLLDIVQEEADRLDRIVRDLLDFARPHEPALERASFAELLDDTLQSIRRSHAAPGIDFDLEVPANLPEVRLDERMIRQVLLNLVLNGIQAMPRGGSLQIRVAMEPQTLKVEIEDEGTGVPPELRERLFQPFFTTKAAGTGLGLAVVKRFIDAHGGTISFHSQPGIGTAFTLRLPLDEAN